ncbi:MAG: hypothetical protein KAJ78_08745 [Acidobacteria bacterium]|nr:hypothetical protein [Acidobacteriota bacterium]
MLPNLEIDHEPLSRHGEKGAALFVALALIIVLTFLGFGLLTRSFLSSRIAGLERWSTKTFYAADGGINAARARLRVRQTLAFNFDVSDFRGPNATASGQPIAVQVTDLAMTGPPRPAGGSQVGGGQGGAEPLFIMFYRGNSSALHATTQSSRNITATMSLGPVPLSIPGT